MNPLNMMKGIMGIGNPKDMAMKMLSQNNNPIFKNLIDMANKGDTKGVENFARNYMKSQGKDFDQELNKFKSEKIRNLINDKITFYENNAENAKKDKEWYKRAYSKYL